MEVNLLVYVGSRCTWPMVGAASLTPGDTSTTASFVRAERWLQDCLSHHKHCNASSGGMPRLPTRVINVGTADDSMPVKLCEPQDERALYICLSHCWGKTKTITTTGDTLQTWKREIPWKLLPQSFRDAVTVVRRLGVRYLWIDSLCIVQDDAEDWRRESSKMTAVYQNAYLTIAATRLEGSEHSIYTKLTEQYRGQEILYKDKDGNACIAYCRRSLPHWFVPDARFPDFPAELGFPLLKRAWVYQERLLSPRVLHFGTHELMWECMENYSCECAAMPVSYSFLPKVHHSRTLTLGTHSQISNRWRSMVMEYAHLELSVPSDRLPAMAGAARQIHSRRNTPYLAGLWLDTLMEDILWSARRLVNEKASDWHAPSWSWACPSAVIYYSLGPLITQYATVLNVECSTLGDPFGTVTAGSLTILGSLVYALLLHSSEPNAKSDILSAFVVEFPPFKKQVYGRELRPDFDFRTAGNMYLGHEAPLHCLRLARTSYRSDLVECCMLLRCVNERRSIFKRVGMIRKKVTGSLSSTWDVFNGVPQTVVNII